MVKQKKIKIEIFDNAENKCGNIVSTGYFIPTLDFIDYLSKNNNQHLPIQFEKNNHHVVITKLNTYPYKLIKLNTLKNKVDKITNNQIPKNSPEFLNKNQYYGIIFNEKFTLNKLEKFFYFPPKNIIQSLPTPVPVPVPTPPKLDKKKKHKKRHDSTYKTNYVFIILVILIIMLTLTFGWTMG